VDGIIRRFEHLTGKQATLAGTKDTFETTAEIRASCTNSNDKAA
jgi:hypothetical protein